MYADFVAEAMRRGRTLPQRRVRLKAPDGVDLVAGLYGDDPGVRRALIFFHGAGANMNVGYLDLARELAEASPGLAVAVPDMRGHGMSGGARGRLERREILWRDVALWRAFAAERWPEAQVFLGGHSAGAALCLNHLLHDAERGAPEPEALVMLAPYLGALPGGAVEEGLSIRGFSTRDPKVFLKYVMSEGAEGAEETAVRFNYPPDMARLTGLVEGYGPAMAMALTPLGAPAALARIDLPTLILGAEADALFPAARLAEAAEAMPRARFEKVGGDHLTCLYHAARPIARWLEGLEGSKASKASGEAAPC